MGSKRKIACCTNAATAYISNSDAGVSFYCFRCGERDFVKHDQRSIAEIAATRRREELLMRDQTSLTMPDDAVSLTEAPDRAIVWLLQGGLLPERAEHVFGFRWHDGLQRVLFPVVDARGFTSGISGRSVDPAMRPKYKVFKGSASLYWALRPRSLDIVLVEDVLSALAVYSAGFSAVALSGTSLTAADALKIDEHVPLGGKVIIWTDPDAAGDHGAATVRKRFKLTGATVVRVQSEVDPKRVHQKEIVAKLTEAIRRT